jgi:hypothetical protein
MTAFETGSSFHGKSQGKSLAVAKNQVSEVSSSSTVIHGTTSVSRPSSNYNNRSQQIGGLQKGNSYISCSRRLLCTPYPYSPLFDIFYAITTCFLQWTNIDVHVSCINMFMSMSLLFCCCVFFAIFYTVLS